MDYINSNVEIHTPVVLLASARTAQQPATSSQDMVPVISTAESWP